MNKRIKNELKICFELVEELFFYDLKQKTKRNEKVKAHKMAIKWMEKENDFLFKKTPFEAILMGQGTELINILKDKLGK